MPDNSGEIMHAMSRFDACADEVERDSLLSPAEQARYADEIAARARELTDAGARLDILFFLRELQQDAALLDQLIEDAADQSERRALLLRAKEDPEQLRFVLLAARKRQSIRLSSAERLPLELRARLERISHLLIDDEYPTESTSREHPDPLF